MEFNPIKDLYPLQETDDSLDEFGPNGDDGRQHNFVQADEDLQRSNVVLGATSEPDSLLSNSSANDNNVSPDLHVNNAVESAEVLQRPSDGNPDDQICLDGEVAEFDRDNRVTVVVLRAKWSLRLICPSRFGADKEGVNCFLEEFSSDGKFVPLVSKAKPGYLAELFADQGESGNEGKLVKTITAQKSSCIGPFPCTSFSDNCVKLFRFRFARGNMEVVSAPFILWGVNSVGASTYSSFNQKQKESIDAVLAKLPLLTATDTWNALRNKRDVKQTSSRSPLVQDVVKVFRDEAWKPFGEAAFKYKFGETIADGTTRFDHVRRFYVSGRTQHNLEEIVDVALYVETEPDVYYSHIIEPRLYCCCHTINDALKEELFSRVGKYRGGITAESNQGHCTLPIHVMMELFSHRMGFVQTDRPISDRRANISNSSQISDDRHYRVANEMMSLVALKKAELERLWRDVLLFSDDQLLGFFDQVRELCHLHRMLQPKKNRTQ